MKKMLLTVLFAALLALPLGGVALAQTPDAEPEASVSTEAFFLPGGVPAETEIPEAMSPTLHGVVLALLNQGQTSFDPNCSVTGWEALYNMLALYGQMDDRADCSDDAMFLPSEIVMDFAGALASDAPLPEDLPAELADRMVYDAENDGYRLACGDDGLAQICLDSAADLGDTVEVTGALVYLVDNRDLATFRAVLAEEDNLFGYTLVSLELL